MVVFGHAKRESYPRGKEAELVTAISEAIGDVVGGNVAPVLVAAILFKEGLDGLWFGYRDLDDHVREMVDYFSSIGDDESALKILKRALEKNPESPEANYRCGSILDDLGRWTEAIEYFEKAIESNPTHHLALNALGFILIEYAVEPKKGFEYAKRALGMTWRGSWEEAGVLDTVGWAYYEQERDLVRAEKCLRRSVALTLPTEPYYITASYHLLAVLVEEGKVVEARGVFERILPVVPHNPIDKKCYREARRLMLQA